MSHDEHPEPVLTRQAYTKWITGALPVAFAVAADLGVKLAVTEPTALAVAIPAGGILVGAVNWVTAHVVAHKIRAVVTPTAAPHASDGQQLISVSAAKGLAEQAAANAAVSGQSDVLPIGVPTPTPWDEDSTLRVGVAA